MLNHSELLPQQFHSNDSVTCPHFFFIISRRKFKVKLVVSVMFILYERFHLDYIYRSRIKALAVWKIYVLWCTGIKWKCSIDTLHLYIAIASNVEISFKCYEYEPWMGLFCAFSREKWKIWLFYFRIIWTHILSRWN